jgi:biopolymer transport protein ExbD
MAKKARIEIIPLIDVIFFLLATFVLFTLSLNKTEGIKVRLPQSKTGEARRTEGTATITITDTGSIAWNKDFISLDEFISRLKDFHLRSPDAEILINGDANTLFSQAIYVFDEARKAGIERVKIETQVRAASRI